MKEYKIPKSTFIGGSFINKKLCDNLKFYFKKLPFNFKKTGTVGLNQTDKNIKDSIDISFTGNENIPVLIDYLKELQKCILLYQKKFEDVYLISRFGLSHEGYNIQNYKKGGGFKTWHHERNCLKQCHRVLVFMTYLNDVEDGGTHFPYQDLITPCKKGLTLVWPAGFTHPHKGQISNTKEKFIITGWLNGIELVKDVQRIYLR
jgi:hypothetical protein